MNYIITRTSPDELMHFGIKGQKWGIRRFQNADGTYTDEGKKRYSGGALRDQDYKKLKTLRENVDSANKKFSKAEWGSERNKADKVRTEAYRELDKYGQDLVSTFAKNDTEFKSALSERKKAEALANEEWKRISDQKFIDSIGSNKNDPRHTWFDKRSDGHYEFGGDGTEYWEQLASKEAQKSLDDARDKYRADCHKALCKMFSNVMDRPVKKAVNEKNPNLSAWGSDLMKLPVTRRMSEFMEWHFDWIEE